MIQISDKTKCCGCTACASVCPKNCISMQCDGEGFLYPVVDADSYHKQFYSQVKLEGNKQNSRALNLLNQVGLIPKNFDNDAFSTDMNTDWKLVDSNIATMRREGLNYLSSITKSKGVE